MHSHFSLVLVGQPTKCQTFSFCAIVKVFLLTYAAPSTSGALWQVRVASALHFLKPSTTMIFSDFLCTLMGHAVGKEELEELLQATLMALLLPVNTSNWPSTCIYCDD